MFTYKILRADFSVWKHVSYRAMAEDIVKTDVNNHFNPVLFVVPVKTNATKVKTAKIRVYHVFGTRGTSAAMVSYRGKVLFNRMSNDTPQAIANEAQDWARANGFTHWVVSYG